MNNGLPMPDFGRLLFGSDGDEESGRVIDPVVLVGWLGVIAGIAVALRLAGVSLHVAQQTTAVVVVLFALAAVLLSPQNGLLLLFLVPAVCNGGDSEPYFFLLEILVYLTVLAGFTRRVWQRRPLGFPHAAFFVLFFVSTLISFPLNLKELWLEIRISDWAELLEGIRRSDLWSNFFYVRTVLNVGSGIALYVLVVNARWSRELLVRLAVAATVLYAAVALVGIFWGRLFPNQLFLTLNLHDLAGSPFSGVGFNTSYFAQYALAYLPLVVLVLAERAPTWAKGLAAWSVLVSAYTILTTYQRGAHVVLAVEIVLLTMVASSRGGQSRARPRLAPLAVTGGLVVLLVGLLVLTPIGAVAYEKMLALWRSGDSYREHVLAVAWRMFLDQPLLGIGSGRFAHMFQFYSAGGGAGYQWGSLSSHNLYAQFLAEQGAVGLLSFLAILGVTLLPVLRWQRQLREAGPVALFVLVSLGAWLIYGLFQYTFLMRSMQLYFWITLGLLAAATAAAAPAWRPSRRTVLVVGALVIAAAAVRGYAVLTRPLPPGLALGVHAREPGEVRWTRGAALLILPVEGRVLRLTLAFPILAAAGRAQTVDIAIDGSPVRRVTLDSPAWRTIDVPVAQAPGSTIRLSLRTAYTVVPAALGLNPDRRRLGVLMGPIGWTLGQPAPSEGPASGRPP